MRQDADDRMVSHTAVPTKKAAPMKSKQGPERRSWVDEEQLEVCRTHGMMCRLRLHGFNMLRVIKEKDTSYSCPAAVAWKAWADVSLTSYSTSSDSGC